ncbi:Hypothetical_protein [Hexamita inflata]|uniref:Hypothetical_protein n=1 Tax=Hexamita inflata TaxID=28002 RepID=A0AA86QUE7_9EUKA|nr:Hypothetical protein HINF_LOCUS53899 [Hexamita inflata]
MITYTCIDGSHSYLCFIISQNSLFIHLFSTLFDQLVPAKPSIFIRYIFYREAYAFSLLNCLALYFSHCEFISQLERVKLNKSGSTAIMFLSAIVTDQHCNSAFQSVHLGYMRLVLNYI